MHKQIASSALSLAVTLATSILPSHEIDFASDSAPPPQPSAMETSENAKPETDPVRADLIDGPHGLILERDKEVLDTPFAWE